jgi:hypothetical protein
MKLPWLQGWNEQGIVAGVVFVPDLLSRCNDSYFPGVGFPRRAPMSRRRATVKVVREAVNQPPPRPAPTPRAVLRELFDLLEEYAPVWYTEELHDRAKAALSSKGR